MGERSQDQPVPEQHVQDGRRPLESSDGSGSTYEVACRHAGREKTTCCWRWAKCRPSLWIGTLADESSVARLAEARLRFSQSVPAKA